MPEAPADGLAMAELRQRVSLQSTTLLDSSVDTENADFPRVRRSTLETDFPTLLIPTREGWCVTYAAENGTKKSVELSSARWIPAKSRKN